MVTFSFRDGIISTQHRERILSGLVLLSILFTGIVSVRIMVNFEQGGYNNAKARTILKEFVNSNGKSVLAIGPTALFPYVGLEGNLTVLDNRSGTRLDLIEPAEFEYIFIDREYIGYHFEQRFKERFPEADLAPIREIGVLATLGYLKVVSVSINPVHEYNLRNEPVHGLRYH